MQKQALTPPGADPAAAAGAGGAPPMDPAAMAGTPGGMSAMPGMAPAQLPPMDPAAGGGMPPGGMPGMPMDPSMMGAGGMPPGAGDPSLAAAAGGGAGAAPGAAGAKLKPEQMMQVISLRLFNIEQQLATVLREKGKSLDPGAMIQPEAATTAGAPKPADDPAMQGMGEQQKAAALHQLYQMQAYLQNQVPEGFEVYVVPSANDVQQKQADARTESIAQLFNFNEADYEPSEAEEISGLEFGAKFAADYMAQQQAQGNGPTVGQPSEEAFNDDFAGTILGLGAPSLQKSARDELADLLGI